MKKKKKDKSTVTPYGTHTFKKIKTRAGGSFMRVGGRRRVRRDRLTAGTFPVVTTHINQED